jgi:hypothetical protein
MAVVIQLSVGCLVRRHMLQIQQHELHCTLSPKIAHRMVSVHKDHMIHQVKVLFEVPVADHTHYCILVAVHGPLSSLVLLDRAVHSLRDLVVAHIHLCQAHHILDRLCLESRLVAHLHVL